MENDSSSQEATNPTGTKRKLLLMGLFVALLSLVVLSVFIFLISDNQKLAEVENSSGQENKQLSFVQKVHFPDTPRFYIKPDKESTNSFIIRDDKGLSFYDAGTGSINSISLYDVVPNLKLGDYTKVDNLVLFATGEGIGVYDLDTEEIQTYNTQDGLVDRSNIKFHPDPYDSNIVWIGTFRGLSRFDLSDRTFRSYAQEIGIPGTSWQPRVFYIDQNTVWVAVGANVRSAGGVARLNKNTGVWTAWGTETFVAEGEVNTRVDPSYVRVGSENNIIIQEDKAEYIFDRELQTWSILRNYEKGEPIVLGRHLDGDWFYFKKQQELHGYNIVTKENVSIDINEIFNSAADTDLHRVDVEYDEIHDRYLLRPTLLSSSDGVFAEYPYIVTFRVVDNVAEDVQLLVFADIYDRYQYVDVETLAVANNEMVMRTKDSVVLYDLEQQRPIFKFDNIDLSSGDFNVKAKLYPTAVIIHAIEVCYRCPYQATTTVWDRETGQLELTAPFNSPAGWRVVWDEESVGVTLHQSHLEEAQSFNLNLTKGEYQETDQHPELDNIFVVYDEFVPIKSSNDVQYIPRKKNTEEYPNILEVKIIRPDDSEEIHRITLPIPVNAFGRVNPGYEITDTALNEDMAWFLTDRGLVKFNLETKQWKIYSSEDGLNQDTGSQLYISDDLFIIDNSLGVTIYQYTEN